MVRSIFNFTILCFLLALASPRATWSCFQAGLIDQGIGPTGGDEIYRMWVEGDDLLVELRWSTTGSPDAAWVLSTPAGDPVATWEMARVPGLEEKHRLAGALSQVAERGFQYRLRLEDPDGVRYQLPFRVSVDCPAKELCRYGLRLGLESTAMTVSEALGTALIRAWEAGSDDLLGDVRALHPELANEIPGLVWQMEQSRSSAQVGCQCEWLTIEDEISTPPADSGSYSLHPSNSVHHSIQNEPGAAMRAGAQTRDGSAEVASGDTWGQTTLGLRLFCTSIENEEPTTYGAEWGSGVLEIGERQVAACPLPCVPRIEHQARVDGCASGLAAGRPDLVATAIASIATTLTVDRGSQGSDVLLTDAAVVDLEAAPDQTLRDQERIFKWSRDSLRTPAATARLEVDSSLDLTAQRLQGTAAHSYAFGTLALEYQMHLIADEDDQVCDIPGASAHSLYDENTGTNGGVVIERWEDP